MDFQTLRCFEKNLWNWYMYVIKCIHNKLRLRNHFKVVYKRKGQLSLRDRNQIWVSVNRNPNRNPYFGEFFSFWKLQKTLNTILLKNYWKISKSLWSSVVIQCSRQQYDIWYENSPKYGFRSGFRFWFRFRRNFWVSVSTETKKVVSVNHYLQCNLTKLLLR